MNFIPNAPLGISKQSHLGHVLKVRVKNGNGKSILCSFINVFGLFLYNGNRSKKFIVIENKYPSI